MAFLCGCFGSRSRIQLPVDDESLPPRIARIIEPKLPSTRDSISSRRRSQRVSATPRQSGLNSEKDALLAVEADIEEESDDDDGATHTSSTVSIPGSRITSIASTFTSSNRGSYTDSEIPPYGSRITSTASTFTSSNRGSYTDSELPPYGTPPRDDVLGLTTAGELYRNIQRQIIVSEEREIDMSKAISQKQG